MKKLCSMILTCIFLIGSLPQAAMAAQSVDFEQELKGYLSEVSAERGTEVTKEDVEATLAWYDLSLEDMETVQQIRDVLGDVIKADLSNLDTIYEAFNLTEETLTKLLSDNGEAISDYIYLDDLSGSVSFYQYYTENQTETPGVEEAIMNELLPVILDKVDLSDAELEKLANHFASLNEYLASAEVQAKYTELNNRMIDLLTAAISGEKTDEEITTEMASIYDEFLPLIKLKAVITLDKDGKKTELSLTDLFSMGEIDKDVKVNIALYDTDSQFLADLTISGDMFESGLQAGEQVENIAKDVIKTVEKSSSNKNLDQKNSTMKTIIGGKLPKTASNHVAYTLLGLFLTLAGLFMYRKVRNDKSEIITKKAA